MVSAPLATYLATVGVQCRLVKGSVHMEVTYHLWLELPEGTIIDATASQFRWPNWRAMPLVYIEERLEWYAVKEDGP